MRTPKISSGRDRPSPFKRVPIGAIFDVVNGGTPSSAVKDYWDGDIPWITPADLGRVSSYLISRGERNISRQGYQRCGAEMVPPGSIVISIRAPIGHMAVAENSLAFNQGCRGLIPRSGILTKFGYYALLGSKQHLQAAGQGTTFLELSRGKLRSEKIALPDLTTQKRIADFLDRQTSRIDELIGKKQRLVELLEERRASVTSLVLKSLGEEGISKPPIGSIFHVFNGGTPSSSVPEFWGGEIPWVTPSDLGQLTGSSVSKGERNITMDGYNSCGAKLIPGNSLIISIRAPIGHVAKTANPLAFSQGCRGLVPRGEVFIDYAYYAFLALNQDLKSYGQGTTFLELSRDKLRAIRMPLPDPIRQKRVAAHIDKEVGLVERLSHKVDQSIERLRELRSALITAAVTGQINVDEWERRGGTERELERLEEEGEQTEVNQG